MNEESGKDSKSSLAFIGNLFTRSRDWILNRTSLDGFMAETEKKTVPRHALNPAYCLGGVTLVAFITLALTGIFLANYYIPSDGEAQDSIQAIATEIPFGFYAKSVHAWSANLMVIAIFLHTLRVFITGSYKRPRELTWIGGVLLMVFTFLFVLTGYILPMDERADLAADTLSGMFGWAKSIPIIGGMFDWASETSSAALTSAYWMHVTILPLAIILFLLFHFWLIRRHGISGPL
jgi:cytochrome b6